MKMLSKEIRMRLMLCAVSIFAATTAFAASAPLVSQLGTMNSGIRTPVRLTIDPGGNILVADPRGGGVMEFNSAGKQLAIYPTAKPAQAVTVLAGGNLLVSQGTFVSLIDRDTRAEIRKLGSGAGQFQMANGLATDSDGNIYVVDSIAKTVKKFDANFNFLFSFPDVAPLLLPTAITYERSGNELAVVDSLAGNIKFFSNNGILRKTVGAPGSGAERFTSPQALSFEYDNSGAIARIYVLDSFQSIVQTLDSTGNFIPVAGASPYIGGYGKGSGKLMNPSDMAFDPASRRLVVANSFGNLTLFGINGGTIPNFTVTPSSVPQSINSGTLTIGGTVQAGTQIVVNGVQATITDTSWSATVTGLTQGPNRITVISTDQFGNTATRYFQVTNSASAPTPFDQIVTLSMPANGSTVTAPTQNISGTAVEGTGDISIKVNGNPSTAIPVVNGSFSAPLLLDSPSNQITITAGGQTITRTILLDPASTVIQLTSPVDGAVVNNATVTINGSVSSGAVSVTVNGFQQATALGSSVTLKPGLNTIEVIATTLQKSSRSKISVTYYPELALSLSTPPGDSVVSRSTISVSGSTTAGAVYATLNGHDIPATLQNGIITISSGLPTEGNYQLAVTAVDQNGNAVTTFRNFVYDSTPPFISVATATGQNISGSAEDGSVVYLKDARGGNLVPPVLASAGAWSMSNLPYPYDPATMNLYALDKAGNSSRNCRLSPAPGVVDISDALKALRIATKLDSPTQDELLHGDVAPLVNHESKPDGKIDIDDVLLIIRRVLALPW